MTHEEAARYLDEFKDAFHGGDLETAMEMGAESLRRDAVRIGEVTTTGYAATVEYPCEDAVSREYLLSLARQDGAYDYVDAKQIADAPSVQPVGMIQKCGTCGHWRRWIDTDLSFCELNEQEMAKDDYCSKHVNAEEQK